MPLNRLVIFFFIASSAWATDATTATWEYAIFTCERSEISMPEQNALYSITLAFAGPSPQDGVQAVKLKGGSVIEAFSAYDDAAKEFYDKMGWESEGTKSVSVVRILNLLGAEGWEAISYEPTRVEKDYADAAKPRSTGIEWKTTVLLKRPKP